MNRKKTKNFLIFIIGEWVDEMAKAANEPDLTAHSEFDIA